MKILVIDDNKNNLDAAKAQFAEHEVTVIDNYAEAESLVRDRYSDDEIEQILQEQGHFKDDDGYWDKVRKMRKARNIKLDFDIVLVDLLIPASDRAMGDRGQKYVGEEMPIGIFLALLAAKRPGPTHIAVFTDINHHGHPGSACLDVFNESEGTPTPFKVEGTQIFLSNTYNWVRHFRPDDLATPIEWCEEKRGDVRAKNWKALLDYMLSYGKDDRKEAEVNL